MPARPVVSAPPPPKDILLTASMLGGDNISLSSTADSTIGNLRGNIAAQFAKPHCDIVMVLGEKTLEDMYCTLAEASIENGSHVVVTVVERTYQSYRLTGNYLTGQSYLLPYRGIPGNYRYGVPPAHLNLINAAEGGNLNKVYEFLRPEIINCGDYYGFTALHWAAYSGHAHVVEELLWNGADANARTHTDDGFATGWTPLHSAAFKNKQSCAHLLLRHGSDINAIRSDGKTPVDVNPRMFADYQAGKKECGRRE